MDKIILLGSAALLLADALPGSATAQQVRIRDLTLQDQTVPVRVMGYGLVGLGGTGDRAIGRSAGGARGTRYSLSPTCSSP